MHAPYVTQAHTCTHPTSHRHTHSGAAQPEVGYLMVGMVGYMAVLGYLMVGMVGYMAVLGYLMYDDAFQGVGVSVCCCKHACTMARSPCSGCYSTFSGLRGGVLGDLAAN